MEPVEFQICHRMRQKLLAVLLVLLLPSVSCAWFDETHLAIAKAAGYPKWYNAAAADVAKEKLGNTEGPNHYVNNNKGTFVTPDMVLAQVAQYDQPGEGHLYGAILAALGNYRAIRSRGGYAENHMAFAAHYIGDLSQPLHHIPKPKGGLNDRWHLKTDGVIDSEVLNNLQKIQTYEIKINSREDLAREVARIANLSLELAYRLEAEDRLITKKEAYIQIGHSASLLKAILDYTGTTK
jgi:hypothetical protein